MRSTQRAISRSSSVWIPLVRPNGVRVGQIDRLVEGVGAHESQHGAEALRAVEEGARPHAELDAGRPEPRVVASEARGSSSHSSPSSSTVSARRSAAPGGWVSGVIAARRAPTRSPTARLAAASRSWRRKSASSYTSASQMARLAAEHFWPLWPKAERTRSRMAWSRSASDVTMIAFLPLVSAKSGRSGRQPRKRRAVSTEPVRMTPSTRGSVISPRPISSSGHGRNWRASARDTGVPQGRRQDASRPALPRAPA